MQPASAPRIYCIPATGAPVAAVFRRGPSNWAHVGRWNLATGEYEPGAWIGGRLFPRRSDLSPDGRYLCYFAHRPSATWEHGESYAAVSRLPWLTALHVLPTCGTWSRGYRFSASRPRARSADSPMPFPLEPVAAEQFATERRRGWIEAPDSPPREAGDTWDQRRNARMIKPQPGGDRVLRVESLGWPGGEFGPQQAIDGLRVRYALETDRELEVLDDLQWADWDAHGRLLLATRSGRLQIRVLQGRRASLLCDVDLAALAPQPTPAPDWAHRW